MILSNAINFVIACGGDPDAAPPGLAIADGLRGQIPLSRSIFAGDGNMAEYRRITENGFEYRTIDVESQSIQGAVLRRLGALNAERQFLRRSRASAVISLGGTVGESLGRAAAGLGLPVIVFEPQTMPSEATRRLSNFADLLCLAFAEARQDLTAKCPIRVTGTPVRRFPAPSRNPAVDSNGDGGRTRRLIVMAGSDECEQLNAFLPDMFDSLRGNLDHWRIIHQTRRDEVRKLKHAYGRLGLNAVATSHIHRLPQFLAGADLVISDACPSVVDELAAAAPPTVVAAGFQPANSPRQSILKLLDQQGACIVVRQCEGSSDLAVQIAPLLNDQRRRRELSAALRAHFRPDAAWQMAGMIRELVLGE